MIEAGRSTPLGPGREFDRIRSFLDRLEPAAGVRVGPGDDAAVFDDGLVVTTDLSIQGVHFQPDWVTAEEAGYRAAAGAVSDLAAMAAEPLGILASVAVPGDGEMAEELMAGVQRLANRLHVPLLGGDLSRSPGPAIVDVVSIGRAREPLLRSDVEPGDEIWVTGVLGGPAAAIAFWRAGGSPPPEARRAFAAPVPRVEEARWLRQRGATAGIDVSDGISGDAGHLAAASGVAIVLLAEEIPLHPVLGALDAPWSDPLELALSGGEDYELLVAAPPGVLGPGRDEFEERFGISLTRIGLAEEGEGVSISGGDGRRRLGPGFDHFARGVE